MPHRSVDHTIKTLEVLELLDDLFPLGCDPESDVVPDTNGRTEEWGFTPCGLLILPERKDVSV